MGIKANSQFNKIIDIYFLNRAGEQVSSVICPRKGRKPDIEISAEMYGSTLGGSLPAFNITIKNLYLDFSTDQEYAYVKVNAGYEGNTVNFTGSIISIFREDPGPDGKSVITCNYGYVDTWLRSYINLDEEPGAKLADIIKKVSKTMGFIGDPNIPQEYAALTLASRFTMNGTASDVLDTLCKQFNGYKFALYEKNEQLYLYDKNSKKKGTEIVNLNYLSTLPQKNVGGEEGSAYEVFSAPWDPAVKPGVTVTYPAWTYVSNFAVINKNISRNAINVNSVSLHFGTCSSVNQMQLSGPHVEV